MNALQSVVLDWLSRTRFKATMFAYLGVLGKSPSQLCFLAFGSGGWPRCDVTRIVTHCLLERCKLPAHSGTLSGCPLLLEKLDTSQVSGLTRWRCGDTDAVVSQLVQLVCPLEPVFQCVIILLGMHDNGTTI